MQHLVGLALLTVLSGTPAVAAICGAWCLPVHHAQPADPSQGCHGRSGAGPSVTTTGDVDCADHGLAAVPTVASLVGSRGFDHAAVPVIERPDQTRALAAASCTRGCPLPLALASTLRPASSRLVLRI
jgi:hypothetical protein